MSKPFFGTFWQNFNKIVGAVFSQSLKNPEMTSNLGFLLFCVIFLRSGAKIKKSGRVTFERLLSPNFIPNFGKILGAVFEICRDVRMDGRTDGTDSIGPAVFNLGPKNLHILLLGNYDVIAPT